LPDLRDRFVIVSGDSKSPGLPAASCKDGRQGGDNSPTPVWVDPYPAAGAAPAVGAPIQREHGCFPGKRR